MAGRVYTRKPISIRLAALSRRDDAGCLIFTGAIHPKTGYGLFAVKTGTTARAHRVAWEEANGPIPTGMQVCHRCDVRACIEPGHLFLGTNTDNVRDMEAKGRARKVSGESHHNARITDEQARQIYLDGRAPGEIAKAFAVSKQTVWRIKSGLSRAAAIAALLATTACEPSFMVVKPEIAPSLLLPCVDPVLAPDTPSDNELAAERIRVARAYVDCRNKHAALAGRVK